VSARNRELLGLVPAAVLVTAGFAAVFIQREEITNLTGTAGDELRATSLTYGALFLGLCVAMHLVLRITLPHADPYLFPLVAVLACFGLVMLYRIDEDLARDQATWFVVGLGFFGATITFLREYRILERYRYIIALAGIVLLMLPRVPGIGEEVNGAFLGVAIGPVSFQPAELTKIAVIVFLASYLRDTRQVMMQRLRLKDLGPMLVVWGASMALLVFIRDLGASFMFFGGFLALLYVATNRISFVVIGVALFGAAAAFFSATLGHVGRRVEAWQNPFDRDLFFEPVGGSYQIAQSMFAQADGGLFGTGFGQALLDLPSGGRILPAAETDLIYALITNELGLAGAIALVGVYLLIVQRGFKIAMLADDSFSKLLATGLTAVFAIQVFVIVGGVIRLIPLTGVTMPLVSYGGSSIVANFILLGLLLSISNRARAPR
jgi:cell division protein FtsW (lipid II flippase)